MCASEHKDQVEADQDSTRRASPAAHVDQKTRVDPKASRGAAESANGQIPDEPQKTEMNRGGSGDSTDEQPAAGQTPADAPAYEHRASRPLSSNDDSEATRVEASSAQPEATVLDAQSSQQGQDPSGEPERTVLEPPSDDMDRTVVCDESRPSAGDDATVAMDSDEPGGGTSASSGHGTSAASSRYELRDNFASGGLGNIWLAEDVRIHRDVAYKELLPGALRNRNVVERFLEEAQITGQLEHPGIVPIYDLGWRKNGTPYYAMKLVRGNTLKEAIEECYRLPADSSQRHLAFTKLLRNFIDICNALAFAHDHGVLHRDLKPLNVMLGDFGETIVLDWGLAKLVGAQETRGAACTWSAEGADSGRGALREDAATVVLRDADDIDSSETAEASDGQPRQVSPTSSKRPSVRTDARSAGSETMAGSIMGTPAYMPPEQALGKQQELDARTDIYSLGAILYEILTNRPPIARGNVTEMLKNVIAGAIIPPRAIDPAVPKPLAAVCMKALSKTKEDRYPNALQLAGDVEAYLADEPVSAYREPWYSRARRWIKRHRTLVASGTAVLLVVVASATGWNVIEARRIESIRLQAEQRMSESQQAVQAGDFGSAIAILNQAGGLVGAERMLSGLKTGIDAQMQNVRELIAAEEAARVAELRRNCEQKLAGADQARDVREDYESARNLITEVLALSRDEPALAELRSRAAEQLNEIETAIAAKEARAAAAAKFEAFLDEVERARFYGTLFSGESIEQDMREARRHALAALAMYRLDESVLLASAPDHLTSEQLESLKSNAYEMLLVLAEAETTLARLMDDEQKSKSARRSLEWVDKAKSLGIVSRSALLREANYLQMVGKDEQAAGAREAADETKPSTALDFFLLAEAERKSQRLSEALLLYHEASRLDPDHFWSMYGMGLCHLLGREPAAAAASFTACISRRPEFPWSYLARGVAYGDVGRFENALSDFDMAIELAPDLMGNYTNRGAVYLMQDRYDEAIADFRYAAELRPDRAEPWINLGETFRRQEKLEQALSALQQAVERAPNHPKVYRIRADVNLRLDAVDAARRDLLKVIALDWPPAKVAGAYKQLGMIAHREGRFKQAVDAYEQSLAVDEAESDVMRLYAEALLALGRDEEAVAAFTDYLKNAEPVGDVYRARALAHAKLGRYRDAVNDYTRSLELEPSAHMLARRGWAYLLEAEKLALQDFDDAIRLNPDNADSYTGRGYAKVLLGDYEGAVVDAESAAERAAAQVQAQGARAWPLFYNASTIYAQAVGRVEQDTERPAAERKELALQYMRRAIKLIDAASQMAGERFRPSLSQSVKTDEALDPIRDRAEFRKAFNLPELKKAE